MSDIDAERPPPPAPPTPAASGAAFNPQWWMYAIAAAVALVVAGAAFGLFGGDDGTGTTLAPGEAIVDPGSFTTTLAESTTTSTATPTTTVPVSTTLAELVTTSSLSTTTSTSTTTTTTLPSSLLDDNFDDSTSAFALFSSEFMTSEVITTIAGDVANGVLEMTLFNGGIIPTMYPDPLPDAVEISFDFNPQPAASASGFGAVVMSEDPGDSSLEHYVAVWANPSDGLLTVVVWNAGWGPITTVAIPAAAGYGPDQWHAMRLILDAGQIDIFINDVFVTTWNGVTPAVTGHWGLMIAGTAGDMMQVDNVLVEALG